MSEQAVIIGLWLDKAGLQVGVRSKAEGDREIDPLAGTSKLGVKDISTFIDRPMAWEPEGKVNCSCSG